MPFGGAVKLTGESEYRKALQRITQNLKEISSEMVVVSSAYDKNDKSVQSLAAQSEVLTKKLQAQSDKLNTLKKQYEAMSSQYREQAQKHEQLVSAYEAEKSKLDDIGKTLGTASKEYKDQQEKVRQLANEVTKSTKAQDDNERSMSNMRVEINKAQSECNKTAKELDNLGNEAKEAGEDAKEAGDGFTVFKGIVANLAAEAISAAVSGLKQMGEALVGVGKQAVSNYANYEQLVGGVETLFKDSAELVEEYAANAYKTAGISANEYMEQVTSFSATLLQGLDGDTKTAADAANMAITDMADNANKMGTSMSSIQNAYQGFAKDNYTMLDNLKLGYGGTQSEMARLINDSGVLGDAITVTATSVKDVPFDKIIEAIHVIQTEIGITGTTALEAASTIQGSSGSMQAAWQNLLTGIADENQDISPLIDNLVASLITSAKNKLPRIRQAAEGIVDLIKTVWTETIPALADEFPELEPIFAAIEKIKEAMVWVKEHGDQIIAVVGGIAGALAAFKVTQALMALPGIFQGLFTAIQLFVTANPIGLIVAAIAGLVTAFTYLWNTSDEFREFWTGLWEYVKEVANVAWEAISGFFTGAWTFVQDTWNGLVDFFTGLWDGIKSVFGEIARWIDTNVFQPIMAFFAPVIDFYAKAFAIIAQLGQGCWELIKAVWQYVSGWFNEKVIQPVSRFFSGLWEGVKKAASTAWNGIKSVWNAVSGWFSASVVQPVTRFFSGLWEGLKKGASAAWEGIKSAFKPVADWFKNVFSEAWQKVKAVFSTGGKIFDGIKEGITGAFKSVVNAIIGGINKVIAYPFNSINSTLDKIRDVNILGIQPFKNLVSRFSVPQIPQLAKGGVLDKGARYIAGEDGAEAIVPLENNTKWIKRVADELQWQGQQIGNPKISKDDSNMVKAFKDALSQMKIELDDEVAGRFVNKTVTRLVYS